MDEKRRMPEMDDRGKPEDGEMTRLLREINASQQRQEALLRSKALTSKITAAMTAAILVVVLVFGGIMTARLSATTAKIDTAAGALTDTCESLSDTLESLGDLSESMEGLDVGENLAGIVEQLGEVDFERLANAVSQLENIDFDSLNAAIEDLSSIISPLAKLFGN